MNHEMLIQKGRGFSTISNMVRRPEYRDAWTRSSLTHLMFQAKTRINSKGQPIPGNGLEEIGAIVRIGRKVLIDLDKFDEWVDLHRVARPTLREKVVERQTGDGDVGTLEEDETTTGTVVDRYPKTLRSPPSSSLAASDSARTPGLVKRQGGRR